jgi:glycosyltransferase involved in cell wall biosynthesis
MRFPRVIESLLSQTCQDFAIVIVDDSPSDKVREIVDSLCRLRSAISYEPNPVVSA